jgi:hypothetical protein
MKKTLAISILMALAIVGFSQEHIQQPTAISTWDYIYQNGEESPFNKDITLQYDERGNLSYYDHHINYPSGVYFTWKRFSHDALNRLTFKHEDFQENSYWWSYKYYYTYDDSSNLLECLVEYSDRYMQYYTYEYAIAYKDVYQYENGKKTRWDHFNFTDSTLVLQNYYLYDYSDIDNWSSETEYNANNQPVTKTEYTYSDSQEVLTKTVANWSTETEAWCNSSLIENTYSDTQELLSRAAFTWSEETETWLNSSLTEYDYSDGILIEKRITNWSDGEISQQKRQLYEYDENGNCTQILFQTMVEGVYADRNRAIYLYDENNLCTNANAERWNDTTWVLGGFPSDTYLFFDDIYSDVNDVIGSIVNRTRAEVTEYVTTPNPKYMLEPLNLESEWFYEIQNEDGSITYQHLEYASDTTIGNERPKIIVRSNTQYDRDTIITEVTHEYVYEEDGMVYWWNNDLQQFTTLYDLNAEEGDEWIVDVGMEAITMHVDAVEYYELNGLNYRTLHVSDANNQFTGDIVCNFGHMTNFFPERLMNRNANFTVDGLRCYWINDTLLYHNGEDDCDAIYAAWHNGIEETSDGAAFEVYPNPAYNILFVETVCTPSLPAEQKYRITNLMGQTVLSGNITAENQQINIEKLPAGMYFITVGNATQKFVVK